MATSARGLVGWSDQRWAAVQEAVSKALARTAKCRQVIPKGADQIGANTVTVPNVGAGAPIAYGPDILITSVQVYTNANIDDQHIDDERAVLRLVEVSGAALGALEDQEILHGTPAPGPAVLQAGRLKRTPALPSGQVVPPPARPAPTLMGAGGAAPNSLQITNAIAVAKAALETAGRPGSFGLLLHNNLVAMLKLPMSAGGAPAIQAVEEIIGSSEIVGTSALDGTYVGGQCCGVLFRLEPAAIDLVQTQNPTVTVLGRTGGITNIRVEEDIAVRVLDPTAVHYIEY